MRGFRKRVLIAMMLVVSAVTALTLVVAERNLAADIERELQREVQSRLATMQNAQAIRDAILLERCHALVRKPRIHAALEDNALDLLYPSAEDELRDVMTRGTTEATEPGAGLRALFYRFLDRNGAVIAAPAGAPVGALAHATEAQLALPGLVREQEFGYIDAGQGGDAVAVAVIATPIRSSENGDVIAALALGFKPLDVGTEREMRSGIWTSGRLYFSGLTPTARATVEDQLTSIVPTADEGSRRLEVDHAPHLMFFKRLNPGSRYAPAFEVFLFPLDQFAARTARLRLQIAGMGLLLLAAASVASRVVAGRLSVPVEKLVAESERSARFSADASHQLKTPVTVLRAGLEELLTRDNLTPDECDAIADLIHQTYRLSSLIEDLLLLSRMDSGRLRLSLRAVDLAHLIAAAVDDLGATPDAMGLQIESDLPPVLHICGEQRYTAIILQNLLENARKYNRSGGRIRISARVAGEAVFLSVGNTGRTIAPAAQAHIFERFHRGAIGENVPGYGLGLNLARELARLHEGDLELVRSADDWTEFEVRFRIARVEMVSA